MDILPKKYLIVAAAAGITAVIAAVVLAFGAIDDLELESINSPTFSTDESTLTNKSSNDVGPPITPTTNYRISTECELFFAMATNAYPNGQPMQATPMEMLLSKYPDLLSPWRDILLDSQKLDEFSQAGHSEEFLDAFSQVVTKEYQIDPQLSGMVRMAYDPASQEQLQQLFEENNCKEYFESKSPN